MSSERNRGPAARNTPGPDARKRVRRWGQSAAAWTDRRPVHAAVLSGLLLTLSFPPFDQPWLQIPAWMLLLRLAGTSRTRRELTIRVTAAVLVWNLGATYWLMMATVSGGVAAITANSLLMVLPWLVIRAVRRGKWALGWQVPAIAGVWTAFEFGHHHWPLSWPWLTLANAWSVWPNAIQWIEWTGYLGVSFWVVSVAVLLERAWERSGGAEQVPPLEQVELPEQAQPLEEVQRKRWRLAVPGAPAAALLAPVLLHGGLGLLGLATPGEPLHGAGREAEGSEAVTVTVLQPDHNSLLSYGGHGDAGTLVDTLLAKSERALNGEGSDLLIWPENAVDAAVRVDSWLSRRIGASAEGWNTAVLTGMIAVETYAPGQEPPLHRGDPGRTAYNVYNSAVFYPGRAPDGEDGAAADGADPAAPVVYHKANLVPVVERFPFVDALARLPLLERVDWPGIMGYGKGERAQVFTLPSGVRMFGLICYDSVYSDWTRAFVRQGAGFISVITNDGWWGNTSGHVQHFEFARLRAIEFRRTVLRSANNGTSGVILPDGSVQVRTPYGVQDAFTVKIRPREALTFYARTGNWVGWGSAGVALGVLLALGAPAVLGRGRRRGGSVRPDVDADVEADVVGGPLEGSG